MELRTVNWRLHERSRRLRAANNKPNCHSERSEESLSWVRSHRSPDEEPSASNAKQCFDGAPAAAGRSFVPQDDNVGPSRSRGARFARTPTVRDDDTDVGSRWIAIDRHGKHATAPPEAALVSSVFACHSDLDLRRIFVLYPIYEGIKSSFYTQANLGTPPIWVGLKNYRRLIDDEFFWRSLKQTFIFMGGVITASILFGLLSAVVLNRAFFGRSAARGIITLPWAFPDVPAVLIFIWMLNPQFGVMNVFAQLAALGRYESEMAARPRSGADLGHPDHRLERVSLSIAW